MIAASDVSAVVVTRGDVDLSPTVESLAGFGEIVIWDNAVETDLAVYGRYAALERCTRDVVYVQDDDVILRPEVLGAICACYEPGVLVANMPERFRHAFYADHALVGFGAIFDHDLPSLAWRQFGWEERLSPTGDEWWGSVDTRDGRVVFPDRRYFFRTCDIVFTALTPRNLLDLPYADREFASAPNRMWKQEGHLGERTRMLELVRQVRDA